MFRLWYTVWKPVLSTMMQFAFLLVAIAIFVGAIIIHLHRGDDDLGISTAAIYISLVMLPVSAWLIVPPAVRHLPKRLHDARVLWRLCLVHAPSAERYKTLGETAIRKHRQTKETLADRLPGPGIIIESKTGLVHPLSLRLERDRRADSPVEARTVIILSSSMRVVTFRGMFNMKVLQRFGIYEAMVVDLHRVTVTARGRIENLESGEGYFEPTPYPDKEIAHWIHRLRRGEAPTSAAAPPPPPSPEQEQPVHA